MTVLYSLAVVRDAHGPEIVIEVEGRYYSLGDVAPTLSADASRGLLDILEHWTEAEARIGDALQTVDFAALRPLDTPLSSSFAAPLRRPGKVICTGTNYYDHLREDMKIMDFDKSAYDILYFMKHSGAVVGAGPVRYPSQSVRLDWEVELAVIFGRTGRRIPAAEAMDYVAGYAVGMDLSARDWQFNPRHFKQFDLVGGKSFDDSSPLGPKLVPSRFVDPKKLALKLWVNGELKQDSSTAEMIWSIPEQIAELSQVMTIEPGDVLYTGSPSGVGFVSDTFLQVGDMVEAEITGLGKLAVTIVPDADADAARRL